ncbi:hypothetical protein TspCOW1_28240 [Thiohalobacter sp. COW1]|uniref:Uncharacterized protein n=1 Tax=Thiohalobacter thiocyanaticus TaxID=585455 RepID=A0A1Z4VUM2_9GAMM|nr:uncharacterized protein FOKN1_2970 [Thiohalobacter thiocyanaticus]BCO32721.1 hypothetical protein TspCOW1_28240 [Thiohalobacter sp. COW1]
MSLRGYVPPDPQTSVSEVRYAVIQTPRRNRKRFPAGCVHLVEDGETAVAQADPARNLHPAQVIGPSKSSEGQYIFYLVEWLT